MIQHIKAIYEGGVLRPLEPLELAEQEVVTISIGASDAEATASPEGPSLFDVFNDAGMIGCVVDAPSDLTTNPRHMEGFGNSAK
jgi:hypothetical protein